MHLRVSVIAFGLLLSCQVPAPADESKPDTVKVAGVVLKWLRTDKEANYHRAEEMIREAARNGAQIVCTTECT